VKWEMEECQEKEWIYNLTPPHMAPCICPFADKQIPLELWGYNSICGWWTGRGGRLQELFGSL